MHEDACNLRIENAWGCMQAKNRGCMQARNRGCMQARNRGCCKRGNIQVSIYNTWSWVLYKDAYVAWLVGLSNGDQEVLGSIHALHHVICIWQRSTCFLYRSPVRLSSKYKSWCSTSKTWSQPPAEGFTEVEGGKYWSKDVNHSSQKREWRQSMHGENYCRRIRRVKISWPNHLVGN